MRRVLGIVLACSATACGYPEFGFVPDDATVADDSGTPLGDSSIDSSNPRDTRDDLGADSATFDTTIGDTTTAVDSVATDTAKIDTATTDTTTTGDTTTGFCDSASPPHAYCNDFDQSTIPTYGWSSFNLAGVGAYSIDTVALSSPNALHAQYTADDATSGAAASVNRTLDAPAAHSLTRFEADIRLDSATYSGDGTLLIKMQQPGGNGIGFGIDAGGFYMETVGTSYHYHRASGTPVAGTWFHVRVEGTLLMSDPTAKVWIDGVLVAEAATGESTSREELPARNFVVGFYGDPAIVTFGARFDNATVDFP